MESIQSIRLGMLQGRETVGPLAAPARGLFSAVPVSQAQGIGGQNTVDRLRSAGMSDDEKMELAASQFESMMVRMMLKQMRATVPEGGLIEKNSGEKMFEEYSDEETANHASSQMGLGLAEALIRQLQYQPHPAQSGPRTISMPSRADAEGATQHLTARGIQVLAPKK